MRLESQKLTLPKEARGDPMSQLWPMKYKRLPLGEIYFLIKRDIYVAAATHSFHTYKPIYFH